MAPELTPADRALLAAYAEAAQILSREVRALKPNNGDRFKRRVRGIVNELDDLTAGYVQDGVKAQYLGGSSEAIDHLRALDVFTGEVDETFTQLHREALQQIVDETSLNFATALQSVTTSADKLVSRVQKQRIQQEILLSEIAGDSKAAGRVKDYLEGQGIVAFNGTNRTFGLEEYSALIVHNVVADTLCQAFTWVLADVLKQNPQRFAAATMRLQHLLDARTESLAQPETALE